MSAVFHAVRREAAGPGTPGRLSAISQAGVNRLMNLFARPSHDPGYRHRPASAAPVVELAYAVRTRMEIAHRAWSVATADVPIEREELAIVFGMLSAIGAAAGLGRPAILASMEQVLGPEYGPCVAAGTDATLRDFVEEGGRAGTAVSTDRIAARAMRYVIELTTHAGVRRWNLQ